MALNDSVAPVMVKVLFEKESESMWAQTVGDGLYRIDNAPFYTYEVSCNDIVRAEQVIDASVGFMRFTEVYGRSGHSTFRVFIGEGAKDADDAKHLFEMLKGMGCYVERANDRLVAIDAPPKSVADMDKVWLLLYHAADEKVWEVECGFNQTIPPWERGNTPP
jgi:hypothetical protein